MCGSLLTKRRRWNFESFWVKGLRSFINDLILEKGEQMITWFGHPISQVVFNTDSIFNRQFQPSFFFILVFSTVDSEYVYYKI